MAAVHTRWRAALSGLVRVCALAIALVPFFVAGGLLNPWNARADYSRIGLVTRPPSPEDFYDAYSLSKLYSRPDAPAADDAREPEPTAIQARAEIIRRDAAAIRDECQRAAGGDWNKWQLQTTAYRARLKAKIVALKAAPQPELPVTSSRYEVLEGNDGFPLFEPNSREYLNYLYDPSTLEDFRRERPVVAAERWLKQRGIDLIFVAIPKMTEVYMEHFLDPCPPDGIIAPHVRQSLLEMLEDDVEVVDGLRLFRSVRDASSEYLYNTCDHHWAPRGMRIMAKEIADRIERYQFGARARYALPIVKTSPGPYVFRDLFGVVNGYGRQLLTPEQYARANPAQTKMLAEVKMLDGQAPPDEPKSPVLIMGHSFVPKFREQLIKELNLLIATRASDHQTTESFADFLREPELLEHCRVVVWICTDGHMTRFHPMPEPIVQVLADE
jgi:SGNH hydrolase-like domain, acetyltransferase AlgX